MEKTNNNDVVYLKDSLSIDDRKYLESRSRVYFEELFLNKKLDIYLKLDDFLNIIAFIPTFDDVYLDINKFKNDDIEKSSYYITHRAWSIEKEVYYAWKNKVIRFLIDNNWPNLYNPSYDKIKDKIFIFISLIQNLYLIKSNFNGTKLVTSDRVKNILD